MRYDYFCQDCKTVFEVEKKMSAPAPRKCPKCKGMRIERYFAPGSTNFSVGYVDRPPWTYAEAKKYKTATYKGRTFKIDPSKHGDIGSWNSPGEPAKKPKKKRGKAL